MARSLARSTSVTQSPGAPLASPVAGLAAIWITWLPTAAACCATVRMTAGSIGWRRYQGWWCALHCDGTSAGGRHAARLRARG